MISLRNMLTFGLVCICAVGIVFGNEDMTIFPTLPIALQHSENTLCNMHSEEYVDNLKNFTLWAYEMRDASAKSTTGVLRGSMFNMGDFRQCLTARAPFPTQYCLTTIRANVPEPKTPKDPFSIYFDPSESVFDKLYPYEDISKQPRNVVKMGWCIPASCIPAELEKHLNAHFKSMDHNFKTSNVTYTAQIPQILCQSSNEQRGFDNLDISFCLLTSILIALVVTSTFWEYNKEYEKTKEKPLLHRILMSFSAKQNFLDLSRTESPDKALGILYGIKTFAIFMIIIDHRFGLFVGSAVLNFDVIEQAYRTPLVSYIFHGDLFVDTFFVVSGILVVYSLLSLFDKKYMNPGFIIFMRYLRLTPAYAFVIFFTATVYYHTGNGVLWDAMVGTEVQDCRQNWWLNLLYIGNYVNAEHMCMVHTWYLFCDLHYFIIAVGLTLLLNKNKTAGLAILSTLTAISVLIPFIIIFVYKQPAFLRFYPDFLTSPKNHSELILIYSKSHTRATTYFIGMFAGYLYYKLKGTDYRLSRRFTTVLLLISTFLLLVCMFGGSIFYDPYHGYDALESAAYGAVHRPIWAIGTFGFMFAASFGKFGFLHKCLSWSPWVPLSKLVYGAYLWHFAFEARTSASVSGPLVFAFFDIIIHALSDICLSFMLALGLYLVVEAPVRRILKEIFMPTKSEKAEPKNDMESQDNSKL